MSHTRTFIAIPVSNGVGRQIGQLIGSMKKGIDGVRWVAENQLHLTLAFLGDVDSRTIPDVCSAAEEAAGVHGCYELTLAGLGAFPKLQRPRILWVGAGTGREETIELQSTVADELALLGHRRETRSYLPHLTIGRVRDRVATPGPLADRLQTRADWSADPMRVTEVHVMASELLPAGPHYTIIGRAKLADVS